MGVVGMVDGLPSPATHPLPACSAGVRQSAWILFQVGAAAASQSVGGAAASCVVGLWGCPPWLLLVVGRAGALIG